jgi:hypothetical protein
LTPPLAPGEVTNEYPSNLGGRLKTAIITIANACKPGLRDVLYQYTRCVTPTFVASGGSEFPVPPKPFPRNPDRCASGRRDEVLCELVGRTVLAYYGVVGDNDPAAAKIELKARLHRLESIGQTGIDQYRVTGSDQEGFTIERR